MGVGGSSFSFMQIPVAVDGVPNFGMDTRLPDGTLWVERVGLTRKYSLARVKSQRSRPIEYDTVQDPFEEEGFFVGRRGKAMYFVLGRVSRHFSSSARAFSHAHLFHVR